MQQLKMNLNLNLKKDGKVEGYVCTRCTQCADPATACMIPIGVKERLPEDEQRILWWHSNARHWYVGVYREKDFDFGPKHFIQGGSATHWMPEPPPPSKEQHDLNPELEVTHGP